MWKVRTSTMSLGVEMIELKVNVEVEVRGLLVSVGVDLWWML